MDGQRRGETTKTKTPGPGVWHFLISGGRDGRGTVPGFDALDDGTGWALNLYSRPVLDSLRRVPKVWAAFYVVATLLWAAVGLLAAALMSFGPQIAALAIGPALASAILIYARLLGRLARLSSEGAAKAADRAEAKRRESDIEFLISE